MKKLGIRFLSLLLILLFIFSFIQVFFIEQESQAATLSSSYTQHVESGISAFPESYQVQLAYLKYLHPNWEFKAYYTGIDWSELTSSDAENQCLKNTIYKTALIDPLALCICGQYGDSNYYCASAKTVNYYLDPRNSLGEAMVFQFLDLSSGSGVTKSAVEAATSGTYLAQYTDEIMSAAETAGINPLHIVATIFQELGKSSTTPKAISGTVSGYEGVYNFYNYGATDGSGAVERGLAKAKELGWTTPEIALTQGAIKVLANDYISAGQTTKYFYKFDVVGNEILTEDMGTKTYSSSNFYWHQYMTNVQDPSTQAGSLYNMYVDSDILDENLTFVIPVYNNMPSSAASIATSMTSSDGTLYYVSTLKNYGVELRSGAGTSYSSLGNVNRGAIVAVTGTSGSWSKVTIKVASSYNSTSKTWSYTTKTGYISTEYLTKVGTTLTDYRSQVDMGDGSNNSDSSGDTITGTANFEFVDEYMYVTPATGVSDIVEKYENAILKDSSGTDISDTEDMVATGMTATIDEVNYTIIKLGDVNGDGKIKASDYVLIKNYIMETLATPFTESQALAADVNRDEAIKASDYVLIKNYIMDGTDITL